MTPEVEAALWVAWVIAVLTLDYPTQSDGTDT